LTAQARFNEALDICNQFLALAELQGDLVMRARALNSLAYLHERLGRNRASVEYAEKSGSQSARCGRARQIGMGAFSVIEGLGLFIASVMQTLSWPWRKAQKLCSQFGHHAGLATSLKLLGVAHLQLGQFSAGDRFFGRAWRFMKKLMIAETPPPCSAISV